MKSSYRKLFAIFVFLLLSIFNLADSANAYVSVKGYYRSNGTYVAPHVRSNPNGLKFDNYGWTPSQGLYNDTYGTRGSEWDAPTWVTDPDYYEGKQIYESNQTTPKNVESPSKKNTGDLYILPSAKIDSNKYTVKINERKKQIFTQQIPANNLISAMVKAETDNRVYTVDETGCLRWMRNETVARRLYGNGWGQSINEIDDAVFTSYKICNSISE